MSRFTPWSFCTTILPWAASLATFTPATSLALDGATARMTTFNGFRAFEVITQGNNPSSDGVNYAMPGSFDGAGARLVSGSTLRIQVNHETTDASVSEVDLDVANLRVAIANTIANGNPGGVRFVLTARQAYARWSTNQGSSWTNTSSVSNTSFTWFCSGQAYAADTFGQDRGFVDPIYITGEEVSGGRLVAIDSVARDLYQLSGTAGSAPGGIGGMPFDAWENAALIDTGETNHIALLLSPDGGSQQMKIYIGVKGKNKTGGASSSFLARNGLAYGSWYYLKSSLPGSVGSTNNGTFSTSSSGALSSYKTEDIDTSPSNPTRVMLADQDSGVFVFNFALSFAGGSFAAGSSSFTLGKVSTTSGGDNSLDSPDNLDWTAATTLAGTSYPSGILFVNEDNSSGETWSMTPSGGSKTRVAKTTVGAESTGIFDLSEFVGYRPGSILIANNQGSPSSMTLLIHPKATNTVAGCGDGVCAGSETAASCPADCSTGPVCADVSGFVDAQGYRCSDWVGYDCARASEDWGYTQAQETAILTNCKATCGQCGG